MSALPSKADMKQWRAFVRQVPTADIRLLRVRGKRPRDRRVTGNTGLAKIDVSSSAGESAVKIDGGPPWSDIAFEAEADPANVMICHSIGFGISHPALRPLGRNFSNWAGRSGVVYRSTNDGRGRCRQVSQIRGPSCLSEPRNYVGRTIQRHSRKSRGSRGEPRSRTGERH
jgi:hypothetical protein